jgi:hypothetical protein
MIELLKNIIYEYLMKIVKELESNKFAIKRSPGMNDSNHKAHWSWGLGEDGILYGKGVFSGHSYEDNWYPYHTLSFGITISEMKRIIKEFGHLLVFT